MEKQRNSFPSRAAALLCAVMILLVCAIPSSAVVDRTDDESGSGDLLNCFMFDEFIYMDQYSAAYPAAFMSSDSGRNRSDIIEFYPFDVDADMVHFVWNYGDPLATSTGYMIDQSIHFLTSGNWRKLCLRTSQPFILNMGLYSEWMRAKMTFPGGFVTSLTITFNGYKPVANSNGGYDWERVRACYSNVYDMTSRPSGSTGNFFPDYFTFFGDDSSAFASGWFLCDEFSVTVDVYSELSAGNMLDSLNFNFPYMYEGNFAGMLDLVEMYPPANTVIVEYVKSSELSDFDLSHFFATSVGGFLDIEIAPGLSFGGILAAVVGVLLLVAFLSFVRR